MKKDFISITDLSCEEYDDILTLAARLKRQRYAGVPHPLLAGKTLAMIFEKASTRTRISFDVGMYDLGGYALYLNSRDTQLGRGETIADTARVMSRYVHGAIMRTYKHETITEFAKYASIPVINALSDKEHPCQILADSLTLKEKFGDLNGLRVAWIGDGNNVCNSLIMATVQTGMEIAVATPKGYEPDPAAIRFARENGGKIVEYDDPKKAVEDAHAIYTYRRGYRLHAERSLGSGREPSACTKSSSCPADGTESVIIFSLFYPGVPARHFYQSIVQWDSQRPPVHQKDPDTLC